MGEFQICYFAEGKHGDIPRICCFTQIINKNQKKQQGIQACYCVFDRVFRVAEFLQIEAWRGDASHRAWDCESAREYTIWSQRTVGAALVTLHFCDLIIEIDSIICGVQYSCLR